MHCDTLIMVNNLDVCRYFYRRTLCLGEPVIDSNDIAVFMTGYGSRVILERNPGKYLEHGSAACRLVLHVDNAEEFAAYLEGEGITVEPALSLLFNNFGRISDPEGNVILLCSSDSL